MMKFLKWIVVFLAVAALAGCGGGGGSAGTNSSVSTGGGSSNSSTSQTVVVSQVPSLQLSIVDGAGVVVSNNSISGGTRKVKAVVQNSAGQSAGANILVTFNVGSAAYSSLSPASGQVLTDANGIAEIFIQPASLNVSGASTVNANASVAGSTGVSASINIQAAQSNVTLASFTPGVANLTAYQSTAVEVVVQVDSSPATAGQVSVNFSAPPCGKFSPASATTNSSGKAVSTYTSNGCSGTQTLSASAQGATANATAQINVQGPTANNILFVGASPSTIYSQQALFGLKQGTVTFQLLDANGGFLDGQPINLSLSSSAIAAGVVFTDSGSSTTTQATAGGGFVTVTVRSGDLPTPIAVNAVLASNSAISASSGGLAVNSGAPVQNFLSFSADSYNIEGWNYDGELSTITVFAADRLAQPVPNGTVISFIAEGGQITPSCATVINANGKSGCSVSLQSQEFRPGTGRVTVLAYAEGLEPFVDTNGDNKFTAGEQFADIGQPFLDSNENGTYDIGEQLIGNSASAGIGSLACAAIPAQFGFIPASVPNTCNANHGRSLIRTGAVIAFSTKFAGPLILTSTVTRGGFRATIQDEKGNAMPNNSVVEAKVSGGTSCTLDGVFPSKVGATPNPTSHAFVLATGTGGSCQGATVRVSVKTPKGNETIIDVITIP